MELKLKTITLSIILFTSFFSISQYLVDFEGDGETKTTYATATVNLSGLDWELTQALIGTADNDKKNGERALRIRRSDDIPGVTEMLVDKENGLGELSFQYAAYTSDINQPTLYVEYSIDQGDTWVQLGDPITEFPEVLTTWSIPINSTDNGRIRFRTDVDGTNQRRINIDDIQITDFLADLPEITTSTSEILGFEQILDDPSAEQSFTIEGDNLTDDVVLSVFGDYEIAETSGGTFSKSISLAVDEGVLNQETIFVRLNGMANNDPAIGVIDIHSNSDTLAQVSLIGRIDDGSTPVSIIIDVEGEGETKGSYETDTVNLSGIDWKLTEVLIGTLDSDNKNGERAFRFRKNEDNFGLAEMLEDKTNGLGTVSFEYGRFSTHTGQPALFVEYSIDQGDTWVQLGDPITEFPEELTTWSMPINTIEDGRIRFITNTDGTATTDRFNVDDIEITNYIITPGLRATPDLLTDFEQVLPNPSDEQSFQIEGSSLVDEVVLNLSGDYEIAEEIGGPYNESLTLFPNEGYLSSKTIYVRLNGDAEADPSNGIVTISSTDAASVEVVLEGKILPDPDVPATSTSPTLLTNFEQVLGAPSDEQTFTVEGVNLTDDVVLTVSGDYEISETSEGTFSQVITLTPDGETLNSTTIFVRLNGSVAQDPANGLVTITSPNTDDTEVNLEGIIMEPAPNILANPTTLTGFEQQLGAGEGPSASQMFEVEGSNLIDDILLSVSGDYEISLAEEGTYSNSITLNETDGSVGITNIYVRLNGPMAGDPVLGSVTLTSTDAEDENVNLEGVILAASSEILATPDILTGFEQGLGANGGPSESQMFEVEGIDLTDDILLSVSGDYEIAETIDGTYSNTLTLNEIDGTVAITEIYVRLNGSEVEDPVIGSITLTSIGAAEVVVNLEGVIFEGCVINTDVIQDDGSLTAVVEDFNYRWINCDDNSWVPVPSGDERTFFPDQIGEYAVILTDPEDINCSDTSDCYVVSTLNLDNKSLLEQVQVYPNPVDNLLHIDANDKFIAKIEVRSIEGKLIYVEDNIYGNTSISSAEWVKGVYLVNVEMDSNLRVVKVVK